MNSAKAHDDRPGPRGIRGAAVIARRWLARELSSCDSLESIPGDQSEELQRSSLRPLLAPLPLADQPGSNVQIAGEDGLARSLS